MSKLTKWPTFMPRKVEISIACLQALIHAYAEEYKSIQKLGCHKLSWFFADATLTKVFKQLKQGTGDRTLKVKLDRDIPQSFTTLGGKTRVTVRYRDQPKTCFSCGATNHERKDCPSQGNNIYAKAVVNTPIEVVDPPPPPPVWGHPLNFG